MKNSLLCKGSIAGLKSIHYCERDASQSQMIHRRDGSLEKDPLKRILLNTVGSIEKDPPAGKDPSGERIHPSQEDHLINWMCLSRVWRFW
jgi:hypothetical protein